MIALPVLNLIQQPNPTSLQMRDRLREIGTLRETVNLLTGDPQHRRGLGHSREPRASPLHPPHARDNAQATAKNR